MKQVENLLHVQAKASSSDRRTVICQAGNVGNVGNVFSCARDWGSEAPSARNSMDRQEEIIVITTNYIIDVTYFSKKNLYKCNFLNVGPSELARVWTLKKLKTLWGKQCCHSWGIQTRAKHRSRLEQFRKHEVLMGVHFLKNECMSFWTLSLSQLLSSTCFRWCFRLQLVWSHRAWRRDEGHGGKPKERKPDLEQLENI